MSDAQGNGGRPLHAPVRTLSGRAAGSGIPRSPMRNRTGTPEQQEEATGRTLRPTDVYAAAKAELHHGPGVSLYSMARLSGVETPLSSPRRGSSASGATPLMQRSGVPLVPASPGGSSRPGAPSGVTPMPPSSPKTAALLRTPSFGRRDGHSILSHTGEEQARLHGTMPIGGIQGVGLAPAASRKSVSAPDSQTHTMGLGHPAPWGLELTTHFENGGLHSPRTLQQQLAAKLIGMGPPPSSSPSPSTSSPTTPKDASSIRPRPPGDLPAAPGHRRRPSKESNLSSAKSESSRDLGSVYAGSPAVDSHPRSPSVVLHDIASPRPSSKQASARNRGIQTLFDAIRSKSEAKLQDALEAFRHDGVFIGLDERHLVTGRTALHEAVALNNIPMACMLLKAGADPNVANAQTGPPLLHAAQHGEVAMVELLLSCGADLGARDMCGSTALHEACAAGHVETARMLIAHGANLVAENQDGDRPVDLLTDYGAKQELLAASSRGGAGGPAQLPGRPDPPSPPKLLSRLKASAGVSSALSSPGRLQLAAAGNLPAGLPRSPSKSSQIRKASASSTGATGERSQPSSRLQSARLNSTLSAQPSPRQPHPLAHAAGGSGGSASAMDLGAQQPHPETLMGLARVRLALHSKAGESPATSEEVSTPTSQAGSNDLDSKRSLSPPPRLELPDRVFRREASKGAGPLDISSAFEQEDAELLQAEKSALKLIFGTPPQAQTPQQASPTLQMLLQQLPQPQQGSRPVSRQPDQQQGDGLDAPTFSAPQQQQQQQQQPESAAARHAAALAAAVPIMPKIRFGVDAMENPFQASPVTEPLSAGPSSTAAGDSAGSSDVRIGSNNGSHSTAIGAAISAAVAFVTGGSSSGSGGTKSAASAAAAAAAGTSTSDGGGAAEGSAPPPLVRDASPIRSPRTSLDGASGEGAGGTGGAVLRTPRGRSGSGGNVSRVPDLLRISQAAQALASRAGMTTSTEALQAHAIAMFKRSAEVQTGSIAWTRGELLGEGAFGKVYAGLNQMTGELMAVKALDLMGRKGRDMVIQLEELRQELLLYKNLMHKHVVGYIDSQFDERTSTLYIFLEYVPGGSIASMLRRFGKFNEELVRNYTRQLLLGLEYLHQQKIVHRDVKGGNVLVSRDGIIKLADFGCSKVNQAGTIIDGLKSLRGSAYWMAPEVIKQEGYGRRADIWSLGCTVIEMLTGKHPWPDIDNQLATMFQIVQRTTGPPRPDRCSDMAIDFLDQCFKYNPNERPTATELLQHPFVSTPEVARRFEAAGGKDLKRSV